MQELEGRGIEFFRSVQDKAIIVVFQSACVLFRV